MTEADRKTFGQILLGLFETFEMQFSTTVASVWWGVLKEYDLADISSACSQYAATGTNRPRPAHIREILLARHDSWPSVEEAWSAAPKSEAEGAYVFQEQLAALSLVQDALNRGDMIAARADFRAAYSRIVDDSRQAGKTPAFWYSPAAGLRWEEAQQAKATAIIDARDRGWLTSEKATKAAKKLESPSARQIANTSLNGQGEPDRKILPLITQLTNRLSANQATKEGNGDS